ncbi:MAG: DUF2997 domain-containing protein [Chitinophagaceae bacterium]
MQKLEFTIKPDGSVTVNAEGYADNTCAKDTEPFLDALKGGKVSVKKKPQYNIVPKKNDVQAKQKR